MERYPYDNNGNLLPGLAVVGGQLVNQSGQIIPKWVASSDAVAEVAPPDKPAKTVKEV